MTSYPVLAILWICFIANAWSISILTIENHEFDKDPSDDGWGEWGDWHPCSRSCGGGVTYMGRECKRNRSDQSGGGNTCTGSDRMYTSCNIQDCPVNSEDFRLHQCALHNNVSYGGRKYEWTPRVANPDENPCELRCQSKKGSVVKKLQSKVIDGTRCREGSFDVCVDGKCESVGCDMLLGSGWKFDKCGECGGNDSSCYLVKSLITGKLPPGYTPVIIVPPGSTNVHAYEKKASRSYLAIRDSNGKYVLNGNKQINESAVFKVAGSEVKYYRKNNKKRSPEHITIKGPTMEMMYIDVLVRERNRGIGYEFYLPQGMIDPNHGEHLWFPEAWGQCSAECGGGTQKRRNVCKANGKRTPNYLCDSTSRPPTTRTCNHEPCDPSWLSGNWSSCSVTCGAGIQTRQVNCVETRNADNGARLLLPTLRCLSLGEKPSVQQSCGSVTCPEWRAAAWSECSVTCGDGLQRRRVTCSIPGSCDATSTPESERNCNNGPCSGAEWITSDWDKCTSTCGEGRRSRDVRCAGQDDRIYADHLCNVTSRPAAIQSCYSTQDCPEKPKWLAEEWSECSSTCGTGVQSRKVVCAVYNEDNYHILSDSDCLDARPGSRPSTLKDCHLENCTYSWYSGSWGPCSVSCLGGIRIRTVSCIGLDKLAVSPGSCRYDTKPPDTEDCNSIPCAGEIPAVHHEENRVSDNDVSYDVTRLSSDIPERCREAADPGSCLRWTVAWFYNIEYGRCDRFWYGGCSGNYNRFTTSEECERECGGGRVTDTALEEAQRNDASLQTILTSTTTASTTASKSTLYLSHPTTSVKSQERSFVHQPEVNEDRSRKDFRQDKVTSGKEENNLPPALCYLRKSSGPCQLVYNRWYFDGSSGQCRAFTYGGCGGNENNFASEKNCVQICGNRPVPTYDRGLLDQNSPPVSVTIKPGRKEIFAQVGKMARLPCMAEGSPEPEVTWHKLEKQLDLSDERHEILDDHSLIISKIAFSDAGSYRCVADNRQSEPQTWTVKLIIKDRVLISETPTDMTIAAGLPAALRCRIQDDVFFVTWHKDGKKVITNDYFNVQPWGDLHIFGATVEDSGKYTCTAYASSATQTASAFLTVTDGSEKQLPDVIKPRIESPTTTTTAVLTRTTAESPHPSSVCRDYPEKANCNIVAARRMCHKHDYAKYCCASCGKLNYSSHGRRSVIRRGKRHHAK